VAAVPQRAGVVLAGSALAVVGISVVLFAGLGGVLGGDDAPSDPDVAASPEDGSEDTPAAEAEDDAPAPEETGGEATPDDEPEPEPEPSDDPSPTPFEPTIDPATVTVQVLDGDGAEGRAETEAVAGRLSEAGYNVVVINDAARTYEQTTVFWTDGFEEQGREMAQLFGFPEVTQKLENLSDTVQVHLVVGADQA